MCISSRSLFLYHVQIESDSKSKMPQQNVISEIQTASKLVNQLKTVEQQYESIINKLPSDCSQMEPNRTGLFMISPGGQQHPIVANCEHQWTTIQRRHDGSVDFNRSWDEYSQGKDRKKHVSYVDCITMLASLSGCLSVPRFFFVLLCLVRSYHTPKKISCKSCDQFKTQTETHEKNRSEKRWPIIINVLSGYGFHAPIFSHSIPFHFIPHFCFCSISIAGFGTPSGEYWIGNTILNHLTVDNCTTLKIIMQDIYDNTWEAVYSTFSVASREDGYRLSISGYRY